MKVEFLFLILLSLSFQRKSNLLNQKIENIKECKELNFLPTEENVKIIGRYYQNNDETWIVQSGSALEFYITGKTAEITLVGDSTIYSDITLRPRFAIYINDKLHIDSLMNDLEINIILFQSEEDTKYKIKVMLLSENKLGGIGIKKITINACTDSKVIEPTEKRDLSIEFIGDSLTCAYGVEGKDEYEHFKTSTENFSKSYAYIAANILNLDYSAVAFSGYGVASWKKCR